jgi:hypothetical protein
MWSKQCSLCCMLQLLSVKQRILFWWWKYVTNAKINSVHFFFWSAFPFFWSSFTSRSNVTTFFILCLDSEQLHPRSLLLGCLLSAALFWVLLHPCLVFSSKLKRKCCLAQNQPRCSKWADWLVAINYKYS